MKHLRLLLILILALIALTLLDSNNFFSKSKQVEEAEKEPNKNIQKVTNIPIPTNTPVPTPIMINPTPSLTPASPTPISNMDSFIYPNSINITKDENRVSMESMDNPQTITDWYKEKINALGMKATSFVQTTTNGNILNKLAGANKTFGIAVEIKKEETNAKTSIRLIFKD